MANNPYVNKVEYGGQVLIDLSADTATAADVAQGKTFHLASGARATGTNAGGGGNPTVPEKDVNFIDYDGTIVYSYTAAEFAALTALPANPSHTGLTAQGWNWTLADAKAYAASYGKLWIGQMYVTDDGKTRLYIRLKEGRLAPWLGIAVNGTAVIDWGDGGATDTITGTSLTNVISTQHTYAAAGEYVIAIEVTSGSMALLGATSSGSKVLWKNSSTGIQNRVYQSALQKIEIGANCSIGGYAFHFCLNLSSITIPGSVTSIGSSTFYNCGFTSITIPSGVTTIENSMFYYCYYFTSAAIPKNVTSIGTYTFANWRVLTSIAIPNGVITIGAAAFVNCYNLLSITIPNSVTTIGSSAFSGCSGLSYVKFMSTTPPALEENGVFSYVPTDCVIYVPRGSLAAYTSATNYPSSSKYTYVEFDP